MTYLKTKVIIEYRYLSFISFLNGKIHKLCIIRIVSQQPFIEIFSYVTTQENETRAFRTCGFSMHFFVNCVCDFFMPCR